MSALEFVGKIGRHFRMGMMLMKDSVKSRLGTSEDEPGSKEGMSFTEFTYQIFQAYDWYYLLKHYECHVQIGGHDQMGNIYAGHELISRTLRQPVYG
jgi:tyrosyl-tRNA synthetase